MDMNDVGVNSLPLCSVSYAVIAATHSLRDEHRSIEVDEVKFSFIISASVSDIEPVQTKIF
jgi:hypothetical protein